MNYTYTIVLTKKINSEESIDLNQFFNSIPVITKIKFDKSFEIIKNSEEGNDQELESKDVEKFYKEGDEEALSFIKFIVHNLDEATLSIELEFPHRSRKELKKILNFIFKLAESYKFSLYDPQMNRTISSDDTTFIIDKIDSFIPSGISNSDLLDKRKDGVDILLKFIFVIVIIFALYYGIKSCNGMMINDLLPEMQK